MRARKLVAALSVYSMLLSQVPFEGITALTANLAPDVPVAVAQTTSSGDFQFEQLSLGSKYQITWLTTITCRNPNGTTQTYLGLDGRGILVELGIPNLVAKAIRDKNLNYTQPTKPLVSSRGGGGGGNRWTIAGTERRTSRRIPDAPTIRMTTRGHSTGNAMTAWTMMVTVRRTSRMISAAALQRTTTRRTPSHNVRTASIMTETERSISPKTRDVHRNRIMTRGHSMHSAATALI